MAVVVVGFRMASNKRRRRKNRDDCEVEDLSHDENWENLWSALRQVQRETACSTKTLLKTLRAIMPFLKVDGVANARRTEKNLFHRSGAECLKLNGCIHCNSFVFLPSDKRDKCPKCDGDRYSVEGLPNEVSMPFKLF